MFSQNQEEKFILEYFKEKASGRFLDIGSFHPTKLSNTRALFNKGWGGIFVEPAPSLFKAFEDEYKDNEKIQLLNIAIGDTTDHVKFYESVGDAVSTTSVDHRDKWLKGGVPFNEITVPMMETGAFFNEYGNGIDMLNIDTEGANMIIFRRVPVSVWERLSLLCIEHDGCHVEIKGTLIDYGMKEIYRNAENIILGK